MVWVETNGLLLSRHGKQYRPESDRPATCRRPCRPRPRDVRRFAMPAPRPRPFPAAAGGIRNSSPWTRCPSAKKFPSTCFSPSQARTSGLDSMTLITVWNMLMGGFPGEQKNPEFPVLPPIIFPTSFGLRCRAQRRHRFPRVRLLPKRRGSRSAGFPPQSKSNVALCSRRIHSCSSVV